MEFSKYTIKEFNLITDCSLHKKMLFNEFLDEIDKNDVSYFYVSMNEDDVIEAINAEKEIAEMLDIRLINIYELGIYIATY
jgi:hypothetical protein